jgi:hypothetical protein
MNMNRIYRILILMTVFPLTCLMSACEDTGNESSAAAGLSISDTDRQLSFGREGGTLSIAVTAGGAYTATVESGKSWCTVSDITAANFKVTVAENTVIEQRTATVTLSLTGFPDIVIAVTQLGLEPALTVPEQYRILSFSMNGGDSAVVVTANGEYSVTVEDDREWCTVSNRTATGFKLSVAANTGFEQRNARVTLSLAKTPDIDLLVTQAPTPMLLIDDSDMAPQFDVEGGDRTVPVTVNVRYTATVEDGQEWCSVSGITATDFKISVTKNSGFAERTAKIVISPEGLPDVRVEITVTQAANAKNIFLSLPENGAQLSMESSFPYTFSWQTLDAVSDYSIAVSAQSDFPDGETAVIPAGSAGSYALNADDLTGVLTHSVLANATLYWKVIPTDRNPEVISESREFRVQRRVIKSYMLRLTHTDERWTQHEYFPDENVYAITVNRGRSDPWVYTEGLTEPVTEKVLTLSYEYKTANTDPATQSFMFEYFVSTPNPDGAKYFFEIIPLTGEWQSHVIEFGQYASDWGWGETGHRFRLDTGTSDDITGMVLSLKNLRIDAYE